MAPSEVRPKHTTTPLTHAHSRAKPDNGTGPFLLVLFVSVEKRAHTRQLSSNDPLCTWPRRRQAPRTLRTWELGRRKAGKRIRPIGEPDSATLVRKCRVPAERAPKHSEWKAAAPTEQTSGPSRRPLAKSRRSAEKQVLARAFIRGLRCWRRLGLNIKKNPPQCRRKRVPLLCVCGSFRSQRVVARILKGFRATEKRPLVSLAWLPGTIINRKSRNRNRMVLYTFCFLYVPAETVGTGRRSSCRPRH